MRFLVEQEIAVPIAVAFDAMADVRNEVHWNSLVTRSELVSPGPVQQGSQFKTVNRGAQYDAVLTAFERPSSLGFEVRGKPMEISALFHFAAIAEGRTRMRGEFEMRPKGFMRLMLPLLSPLIRRDFPQQGRRFKEFCEGLRSPR